MKIERENWSESEELLLKRLSSNKFTGLSERQVFELQKEHGKNLLKPPPPFSIFRLLLNQFKSLIVALLTASCLISFYMGEKIESLSIFLVLIVNALIGFFTEFKAKKSMLALRKMTKTQARVLRESFTKLIDSEDLVPGDIVILEPGDLVPADIRILEGSQISVDESMLTGESLPVSKLPGILDSETPLSSRSNLLYQGTALFKGTSQGVVVSIGAKTELGQIAELTESSEEEETPLEKKLERLGRKLLVLILILVVVIASVGFFAGRDLYLMLEVAIALAVAAIPEGLPIVATIALARGMWRMAERNVLINKLSVVETLGATNLLMTDKTGTLTENKMSVQRFVFPKELNRNFEVHKKASEIGVLCNNAIISEKGGAIGDPMEVALLSHAQENGTNIEKLKEEYTRILEIPFDSNTQMMATLHEDLRGEKYFFVKGAPEKVIHASERMGVEGETEILDQDKKRNLTQLNESLASEGLRLLGLAYKKVCSGDRENPYESLNFLGFVGFWDPPRKGIREAIQSCQDAGIRLIMLTGDQAGTALYVAKKIGIQNTNHPLLAMEGKDLDRVNLDSEEGQELLAPISVFSRVTPKQKLDLVHFYQKRNQIVAMTGDGVNDAPALKKSNVGISMGIRGTQVAKEASDVVLRDDRFESIVEAIYQGRVIFHNIRRFVIYLLSCNLSEVSIVGISTLFGGELPLLPLQILFLNLVTDVFPALALGMGEGDPSYLKDPPRDSKEPMISNEDWRRIVIYGALITTSTLFCFWFGKSQLELTYHQSLSVSFLTLGFAQIFHVFNMNRSQASFFVNDVTKNPHLWWAIGVCCALLASVLLVPWLSKAMNVVPIGGDGWILVSVGSLFPLFVVQGYRLGVRQFRQFFF